MRRPSEWRGVASSAAALALVVACGGDSGTQEPEPVAVHAGGEEVRNAEAPVDPPRIFGPSAASEWAERLSLIALSVIEGNEPPPDLPLVGRPGPEGWVESHGEIDTRTLAGSEVVLLFVEVEAQLTTGQGANVTLVFTRHGARVAELKDARHVEPMVRSGFLAPLDALVVDLVEAVRRGEGMDHVLTAEELRSVLPVERFVERATSDLPTADDVAQVAAALGQGANLAAFEVDEAGVLLRAPDGSYYGCDLTFERSQDDVGLRAAPLVRVQRLPD